MPGFVLGPRATAEGKSHSAKYLRKITRHFILVLLHVSFPPLGACWQDEGDLCVMYVVFVCVCVWRGLVCWQDFYHIFIYFPSFFPCLIPCCHALEWKHGNTSTSMDY